MCTNTVVEGYIGKRYHAGCKIFNEIESLAIERCKKLFKAKDINVQPYSGSQANQGAFLGILKKGDKILSLSIKSDGHISHNITSFLEE
jgi:glycine hydroxymethyltransferase